MTSIISKNKFHLDIFYLFRNAVSPEGALGVRSGADRALDLKIIYLSPGEGFFIPKFIILSTKKLHHVCSNNQTNFGGNLQCEECIVIIIDYYHLSIFLENLHQREP